MILLVILVSPILFAEDAPSTSSGTTETPALPSYFNANYGQDPTQAVSWQQDYCNNNTTMDFVVEVLPEDCEGTPVRSDFLEENDVPIFCKLTAIKINPLIQVPYIKRIDVIQINKSAGIIDANNFFPAQTAYSYYNYDSSQNKNAGLEGVPTMNNLGYLMIRLKKQPIESKMPDNVTLNMTAKITYDVAKTYGVSADTLVLKKMTDQDWLANSAKYSFWNGKGYLRLLNIQGTNDAEIALYTSPGRSPTFTGTLSPNGPPTKPIKLPYFYCEDGPTLKLEKLSEPKTKARLLVNGDELVLAENEDVSDSGCKINSIEASDFTFTGKVKIACMGKVRPENTYDLTLDEVKVTISADGKEQSYSIGDKVKVGTKNWYLGYAARDYIRDTNNNNELGSADFAILYGGKEDKDDLTGQATRDREKISQWLDEFYTNAIAADEHWSSFSNNDIESMIKGKLTTKISELKQTSKSYLGPHTVDNLGRIIILKKGIISSDNMVLTSIAGQIPAKYSKEVEQAYDDAIKQYQNIAYSYSQTSFPEGSIYGIVALRKAADLAGWFQKRDDQKKLLTQITDKYSDSTNADILNEIEGVRGDIAKMSTSSGKTTQIIQTENGNYFVQLISVERPGIDSLVAHVKIDNEYADLTLNDNLPGSMWYVSKIVENSIELKNSTLGIPITIGVGGTENIDGMIIMDVSNDVNLEATVQVIPFTSNRATEANFTIAIGIEKRAIQLSPDKINSLVNSLNSTIDFLNKTNTKLGNLVSTWQKACYIGGAALWVKNLVTGLNGESIARREVMKKWKNLCGDKNYRIQLYKDNNPGAEVPFDISPSTCYKLKNSSIETDVELYQEAAKQTDAYIKKIKSETGVISKGGLFGTTEYVNDEKFMIAAQALFPPEIKEIKVTQTISGQTKNADSTEFASNILESYKQNILYRDQFRDIVIQLYLFKACKDKSQIEESKDIFSTSAICKDSEKTIFSYLYPLKQSIKEPKTDEFRSSTFLGQLEGINSQLFDKPLAPPEKITMLDSIVGGPIKLSELGPGCPGAGYSADEKVYYTVRPIQNGARYFFVLEDKGDGTLYQITRAYKTIETTDKDGKTQLALDCSHAIDQATINKPVDQTATSGLGLQGISIHPVEPSACQNNKIIDNEIKFWESGQYQSQVALMPIERANGWYFATESYSGFEGGLTAYAENGNLNFFYVCNVGPDGKINFDFNQGAQGDDADCCFSVNMQQTNALDNIKIFALDSGAAKKLVNEVTGCIAEAKTNFAKGLKQIKTKCGNFNLAQPPASTPSLECEDFMSPGDCSLLYNLCDPVVCPASRCNLGGKYPVENVIQEGIIGSLALCLPNFDNGNGVLMPICLSGLHAGLEFLNQGLMAYRDCLQENLNTGKTVGICDEMHSIFLCDLLWRELDPILKAGIPAVTNALNGGGEYNTFTETWKNSMQSIDYFTQVYAPKTIQAFKSRSTKEIGTEVCKKFISIAYPSPGKLLDDLSTPVSPPQAWAEMQEVANVGPTPDSHYKVHYLIYAGTDQGVYYSVYLKNPPASGYYNVPDQVFLPNATGYLQPGQRVDQTPDFMAPSGYKEVCFRLNTEEHCGFGTASTSFAVDELQSLYLKNQLTQQVKTTEECQQGTPSIIPAATLNLQSMLEQGINPELYKKGIVRLCYSQNPGAGTGTEKNYERIGYCDNQKIGCWLDLSSVNETIHDLGIREDVIDYSKNQDYLDAINRLGLDTVEETTNKLKSTEGNLAQIESIFTSLWADIQKWGEITDETDKSNTKTEIQSKIHDENKEIEKQIKYMKEEVIAKAYDPNLKAEAEYKLAQLLEWKAKFTGALEVFELGQAKAKIKCTALEPVAGVWQDGPDCLTGFQKAQGYQPNEFADYSENQGKICCLDSSEVTKATSGATQFRVWPTLNSYKIPSELSSNPGILNSLFIDVSDGENIYSIGNGTIIKTEDITDSGDITNFLDKITVLQKTKSTTQTGIVKFETFVYNLAKKIPIIGKKMEFLKPQEIEKSYILTINYGPGFYAVYAPIKNIKISEKEEVIEGQLIGEASKELSQTKTLGRPGVFVLFYTGNPKENNKISTSDLKLPLCFFSQDILDKVKDANTEEIIPSEDQCKVEKKNLQGFYQAKPQLILSLPFKGGDTTGSLAGYFASALGKTTSSTFLWPVQGYGTITGYIGDARDDHPGYPHEGIDIAAPLGTSVKAIFAGKVTHASYEAPIEDRTTSGGNIVTIEHTINGQKIYSKYMHLNKMNVKVGASVKQGQVIGTVGATGTNSPDQTHLHLEIRKDTTDGDIINPLCVFSESDLSKAKYDKSRVPSDCATTQSEIFGTSSASTGSTATYKLAANPTFYITLNGDLNKYQICAESEKVNLLDEDGTVLKRICKDFVNKIKGEGVGVFTSNAKEKITVNYDGLEETSDGYVVTRHKSDYGGASYANSYLLPERSLAIYQKKVGGDAEILKYGNVYYIPEVKEKGCKLPDGTTHDGLFIAQDTGADFRDDPTRIDMFVGIETATNTDTSNAFTACGIGDGIKVYEVDEATKNSFYSKFGTELNLV